MTDFPTLSYTSSSEIPYNPFVYLKPEEGTPFGWNLPIQVIAHFTVAGENEAGVDLVLIQPFLLYYVNHVFLMLTSIF